MDKRALGERIRTARKALGWTQEVLANKLFISESYLTLIELGKRNISVDTVAALRDVLGLSADYLLFGTTAPDFDHYTQQFASLSGNRPVYEIENAIKVTASFYAALDGAKM